MTQICATKAQIQNLQHSKTPYTKPGGSSWEEVGLKKMMGPYDIKGATEYSIVSKKFNEEAINNR